MKGLKGLKGYRVVLSFKVSSAVSMFFWIYLKLLQLLQPFQPLQPFNPLNIKTIPVCDQLFVFLAVKLVKFGRAVCHPLLHLVEVVQEVG